MKCLFLISICIASFIFCHSKSIKFNIEKMNYEQVASVIDSIANVRNLSALEALASQLNEKQEHDTAFCRVMLHICNKLSSVDFGDYKKQAQLESQYALLAIDKSQRTADLSIKLGLIGHILYNDVFLGHTENMHSWSKFRKMKVTYALDALEELYLQVDEDFDFKSIPMIESYLGIGNIDSVKNIKKIQKINEYNLKMAAKNLYSIYAPKIMSYIKDAYSIKPKDKDELISLFKKYNFPITWKEEILHQLD